jgi:hypothetical protein
MCEGASYACVFCQLVTDVWRAKAVPYAHEFGVAIFITSFDGVYPFRYRLVSERCVLTLPCFVVEVRIRMIVPIFAVFPDRVLVE